MREMLFRMYDGVKMVYDGLVICDGELYEDWRAFEDGVKSDSPLMQYTGLKDKKGKKIFEGDILNLKYPRDRRYKVVAKVINGQEISAMVLKFDNDFTTEEFPLYKISAENNLEVIGNVHDNPELVENDTD